MKSHALTLLYVCASFLASAQAHVDSLFAVLRTDNHVVLDRQLYMFEDHGYLRRLNPDRETWPALTLAIAEKVIAESKSFDQKTRIRVIAHQAEVLSRSQQGARGYALINEALRMAKSDDALQLCYVFYKYADISRFLGRYDSAIFYAEKALGLAVEIDSDSIEQRALEQVAMLTYSVKNNAKAALYYKKLATFPFLKNDKKRDYFNAIALTFRRRAIYDSAIFYFQKSLEFAENDTAWVGLLNGNIGYTYYLNKQYDRALPGLLKDVDYSFRARSFTSGLSALVTVTSIHILRKDMKNARLYYDSLSRMVRPRDRDIELEYLRVSADYYKAIGDLNRSLNYLEDYIAFNDSIRETENLEQAATLDAQFDFERQVKKIENLEMQSKLQKEESRLKNYYLIGTSIFIILGSCLLYVMFRSNRFKNETNLLLQEQNRQISDQAVRLNELNNTKDKLFSIISHDLRGPINSLKGLMSMLHKKMVTPEEFSSFSGQLQNNFEHVHFTLENLLQWSRSQLQGIQTRPVAFCLGDMVQENFSLLQDPAKAKSIEMINEIANDFNVFADPDQIRLVLRNLLSNAVKFTPLHGKISVSSQNKGAHVIISVSDTGAGISEEARAKLFNTDAGYTSAGTEGEKGTGLGLSLCKEMIEKNNGQIWAENSPAGGASFKFSIPRQL